MNLIEDVNEDEDDSKNGSCESSRFNWGRGPTRKKVFPSGERNVGYANIAFL